MAPIYRVLPWSVGGTQKINEIMNKIKLSLISVLITLSGGMLAGEPFGVNLACGDFGSVFPGEYNRDRKSVV